MGPEFRKKLLALAGDRKVRRQLVARTLAAQPFRPSDLRGRQHAAYLLSSGQGGQGGRALDGDKIDAAYVGFRTDFFERFAMADTMYEQTFMVIDDDREVNKEIWLSGNPVLRDWIGPKKLFKYRGESQTIKTMPKEASVLVPKRDVINDRLGMYQRRIAGLGDAFDNGIDAKVVDMFVAGVAGSSLGTTYDGQNLIDTDHVMLSTDAGVAAKYQSNKVTGALSITTFTEALRKGAAFKDENGNPLNIKWRYLLHGPAQMTNVDTILRTPLISSTTNVYAGAMIPIMNARITGTEWAILPEGSSALLVHRKRGPEFLAVDQPDDSWVFDTGDFKYGIEGEFGVDYGMWQEIVGGPGS